MMDAANYTEPIVSVYWGNCSRCGSPGMTLTVVWPDGRPSCWVLWCRHCQEWETLHVPELNPPEDR